MFLADADKTCLRQGDILDGVVFPRLSAADIVILGRMPSEVGHQNMPALSVVTHVHREDQHWISAQVPVRLSLAMVITQCCDLEVRDGHLTIPAFAVARLIPIPKKILADAQRLASLRANKDPRVASDPGYVNFFYVPAHPLLGDREWIVDFNQLLSIPSKGISGVLTKKRLQLEDDWRVKFKIKLATSVARLTDEERAAGLQDPWRGKQTPIKFPEPNSNT